MDFEQVGKRGGAASFEQTMSDMPDFAEHVKNFEKRRSPDMTIDDFCEKVKLPADDSLIKKLVGEFLYTEPKQMRLGGFEATVHDSVYNAIQIDNKNKAEEFNAADKRKLEEIVSQDILKSGMDARRSGYDTQAGWKTFKSWRLLGTERITDQSQRLYISVPGGDVHKVARMTYETLRDEQIPFYFKVQDEDTRKAGRKDSIVLYTSADLLMPTVNALRHAGEENPDVIGRCREPGPTLGKVNDWIGYASETSESPKDSYNGMVGRCVFAGMGKAVEDWGNAHSDRTVHNGEKTVSVSEFFHEGMVKGMPKDEIPSVEGKMELIRRMQYLVKVIPKVDKNFIHNVCDGVRVMMDANGLDSKNLCMTPYARGKLAAVKK